MQNSSHLALYCSWILTQLRQSINNSKRLNTESLITHICSRVGKVNIHPSNYCIISWNMLKVKSFTGPSLGKKFNMSSLYRAYDSFIDKEVWLILCFGKKLFARYEQLSYLFSSSPASSLCKTRTTELHLVPHPHRMMGTLLRDLENLEKWGWRRWLHIPFVIRLSFDSHVNPRR